MPDPFLVRPRLGGQSPEGVAQICRISSLGSRHHYLPTAEGWLYLACNLDLCSRRVIRLRRTTQIDLSALLVSEAWTRAIFSTPPDPGLLHHSDRGSQYASEPFRRYWKIPLPAPPMSRKANPYDNAFMESFFATLKTECFGGHILNHVEARLILFD